MLKRMVFLFPDIALASLILIPAFFYFNKTWFRNIQKSVIYYLLAVYLCAVYSLAGLPDVCYVRFHFNVNFHPFAYMFSDLDTTLLNILLFLPLGFMLPVLWTRFRSVISTVGAGLITSLSIEFLQIFTYRATDINDLFTNTAGTFVGWVFAKMIMNHLPNHICENTFKNLWIVSGASCGIMFFVHPLFSRLIGI